MARFMFEMFLMFGAFGLGYWVAEHPTDTRSFLERVRQRAERLFHRGDQPPSQPSQ